MIRLRNGARNVLQKGFFACHDTVNPTSTVYCGAYATFSSKNTPASRRSKLSSNKDFGSTPAIYNFDSELSKYLKRIDTAMQPLIELNDSFSTALDEESKTLTIHTLRGKFIFRPADNKLIMHSYISGLHTYDFDPSEGVWRSVKDNHDLRGLLTRDILRHCTGCPRLD